MPHNQAAAAITEQELTNLANKRLGPTHSANELAHGQSTMCHHSYFSAVQGSAIGTFISVTGAFVTKRLEHLSQSKHTHSVHSMELWCVRQSLLQTYVPSKGTGSSVCHPSCPLHPSFHHCSPFLTGGTEWTHAQSWVFTPNCISRVTKDRWSCWEE